MNETMDKWLQRAMTVALVALALGLVVLGVALYASGSPSGPATMGFR